MTLPFVGVSLPVMLARLIVTATAIASAAVLAPSPALAVRLPTNREAKALLAAFKHDRRVPKGATVNAMRVSTKGAWARIDWLPASAQARAAKVKIITMHSSDYSRPSKPKPATKPPPKKVRDDLDHHLHLQLKATISGGEDAHSAGSSAGDCSGRDTGTIAVEAHFSWTETWDVDIDSLSQSALGLEYVATPLTPFIGSALDTLTTVIQEACGGSETITCTTKAAAYRDSPFVQITSDGVVLPAALNPTERSCSDREAPDNLDLPRWLRTADLGFIIPLQLGIGGHVSVDDSYAVSFAKSAIAPDGPAQSTTLGLCKTPFDSCSDNIDWSGTVQAKLH